MKVKINEVHSVFAWSWHIPSTSDEDAANNDPSGNDEDEDVCGICRASYNGTCPSCKFPGDQCPLVIGLCHHNFHDHCIYRWLDTPTSKGLCPMCRQTFQLQKGLAINDAHVQKFVEIVSRRREEMIEEGVAEEFVDFDEPIRQNTDNPIGRQQVDTILDEDFLLR
ncbi:BAG_1a_G0008510.mRNA.1.CDS.1 [Saccharomyces cerevisiae]|nr:SX2_G0043550.mRNA.1.CDS.1 [Saccharomyces cerevisiae]CAI4323010.1 BAG_1a_G0008510.mRNA.1.CDS.1 [Saccharomyces cerevisiae]CAI4338824.1 APG_G0008920.mRNA.1.CDS.1 [Saccharomyces cerevisiae]CAI7067067.1 BAG_1a_G0008510.mRNA.1.CDS.1 [Saccharomyces cerevisiae]CAI7067362.1 APG_G0008920.mRNA.1.CDS.1 [Saccharomyces cerevisiae]